MRDAMLIFGEVTASTSSTSLSSNTIKIGGEGSGTFYSWLRDHVTSGVHAGGLTNDVKVVFQCTQAGKFTPVIAEASSDGNANTFTQCVVGRELTMTVGQKAVLTLPEKHKFFLKAGSLAVASSSGKCNIYFEIGTPDSSI